MTAMISRRKLRLSGVLPFEHSGRMRHTNEKHCVLAGFGNRIMKCAAGMLLEHAINMLDAGEIAFANAIHSLVQPADRRSECNAGITNFSFAL